MLISAERQIGSLNNINVSVGEHGEPNNDKLVPLEDCIGGYRQDTAWILVYY